MSREQRGYNSSEQLSKLEIFESMEMNGKKTFGYDEPIITKGNNRIDV